MIRGEDYCSEGANENGFEMICVLDVETLYP